MATEPRCLGEQGQRDQGFTATKKAVLEVVLSPHPSSKACKAETKLLPETWIPPPRDGPGKQPLHAGRILLSLTAWHQACS